MVSLANPLPGISTGGVFNRVIKFAISGVIGGLILVFAVSILGPVAGGLIGGVAIAALGEPQLGMVVAFDGMLNMFIQGGL